MKRTSNMLIALLSILAVASTVMIWGLDRLSAQIVHNDSAWQALDANDASWEHTFAEGVHSVPFLLPTWVGLCSIVMTLLIIERRKNPQNISPELIDAGASKAH